MINQLNKYERPLLHLLQHHVLPQNAFENHPELMQELTKGFGSSPLFHMRSLTMVAVSHSGSLSPELGRKMHKEAAEQDQAFSSVSLEKECRLGYTAYFITMPAPRQTPDCYYVAIVHKNDESHDYDGSISPCTRYFTLESSAPLPPQFCEWKSDRTRSIYGATSDPSLRKFSELVFEKISEQSSIGETQNEDAIKLEAQLLSACENGDIAQVRSLIAEGANLECKTSDGWTPLIIVAHHPAEITQALIVAGANLNAQSIYGYTALQRAASLGKQEVVQCLLTSGADPELKDQFGKSAAEMALENAKVDCLELIAQSLCKKPPSKSTVRRVLPMPISLLLNSQPTSNNETQVVDIVFNDGTRANSLKTYFKCIVEIPESLVGRDIQFVYISKSSNPNESENNHPVTGQHQRPRKKRFNVEVITKFGSARRVSIDEYSEEAALKKAKVKVPLWKDLKVIDASDLPDLQ